jgi:hypothetical protein
MIDGYNHAANVSSSHIKLSTAYLATYWAASELPPATRSLPPTAAGLHAVGSGYVLYESQSPAAMTYLPNGGNVVYDLVQRDAKAAHLSRKETNALILRRGPYVVAAGMDKEPSVIHKSSAHLFIRDRRPNQPF